MSILNTTSEQFNLPVGEIAKNVYVGMLTQKTSIGGGHDYGRRWDHDAERARCEVVAQEAIKRMTDLSTKSVKDAFEEKFGCRPCFRKHKVDGCIIFQAYPSAGETSVVIPTELADMVIVGVTIYIYI